MIFQTQNQINCLLIFIFFGIISGLISILFFLIFTIKNQKKLIKLLFESIFYSFLGVFFVFLINFLNFGHFSPTLLIGYILGYLWIKRLMQKSVVILETKWYTKVSKIYNKLKNLKKKRESKNEQPKQS